MKRVALAIMLAALIALPIRAQQLPDQAEMATVIRVVDGEIVFVRLTGNGEFHTVRLIGINAPERDEPCYSQAKDALEEMLPTGSEVYLEADVSNLDNYSRPLRYIYLEDIFINARMVELGWAEAVSDESNVLHTSEFSDLTAEARRINAGCWSGGVFGATAAPTWRVNSGNNVNVRSCASTSCSILTSLAAGMALNVISTENDWHAINLTDGRTGYVAAWLTTRENAAPESQSTQQSASTGACTVQGNNVNLRAGPGINYRIAGLLVSGAALQATGRSSTSDWYVVSFNGRQAWVSSSVITVAGNCSNLRVMEAPPLPTPRPAPVVQSAPQSQPAPQTEPAFTCNCNKLCGEMASCQEAYFQLNQCHCRNRDSDHDGVPCESICSGG